MLLLALDNRLPNSRLYKDLEEANNNSNFFPTIEGSLVELMELS